MSCCSHSSAFLYLGLCLTIPGLVAADELSFTQQTFQLSADVEHMIIADTNSDGLNDLITVRDHVIRVYFQDATGFNFESGFDELELTADAVGWNISSAYSDSGSASIVALIDGTEVLVWHIKDQTIQPPQVVKSGLDGYLSKGFYRLHFNRDVNGDGHTDLVIPGVGVLNIYVSDGDGHYQPKLSVQSDTRMRTNLNSTQLERRIGQEIRIPLMELRDVNSDGFDDLISRTDERLDVFLADGDSKQYFPATPSYTLDIAEIEQRVSYFDIDDVDFSNLTGLLSMVHEEILEDIDGDGIDDLLLREGGKISLYAGTIDGMNFEQARQVLRSGGNVLTTFLFDENEDGLKDLWLWRSESLSVGYIFFLLALSVSSAIEALLYPHDCDLLSRRPSRHFYANLNFPSAIRLATTAFAIMDDMKEYEASETVQTSVANLDRDLSKEDLLVLINSQLQIFLNQIEPKDDSIDFLETLDYDRNRDEYEIDIRKAINAIRIGGNPHLDLIQDRAADLSIDLQADVVIGAIIPLQLNDDGLADVLVLTERNASHIKRILLLSN